MTTEDPGVSAHERRVRHLPAELREEVDKSVCHVSMCSASLLRDAADEIERLRALCAAAYQVVGAANGPTEMLDNLLAAGSGQRLLHEPMAGLPWTAEHDRVELPRLDVDAAHCRRMACDVQEWMAHGSEPAKMPKPQIAALALLVKELCTEHPRRPGEDNTTPMQPHAHGLM